MNVLADSIELGTNPEVHMVNSSGAATDDDAGPTIAIETHDRSDGSESLESESVIFNVEDLNVYYNDFMWGWGHHLVAIGEGGDSPGETIENQII